MNNRCSECNTILFKDDTGELFCPECYAEEFLQTFDEADDSWMSAKHKVVSAKTKPVTIRMSVVDIERLKKLAKKRGIGYQTLLKSIINESLNQELA